MAANNKNVLSDPSGGVRSPKGASRRLQGRVFLPFQLLEAARFPRLLALSLLLHPPISASAPISIPHQPWALLLSSLIYKQSYIIRGLCGAHPANSKASPHFKILNLITSAKTLLLHKATSPRVLDMDIFGGHHDRQEDAQTRERASMQVTKCSDRKTSLLGSRKARRQRPSGKFITPLHRQPFVPCLPSLCPFS